MAKTPKSFVPNKRPKSFTPNEQEYQIDDVPLDPNKLIQRLAPPPSFSPATVGPPEPYPSVTAMASPNTLGGKILAKGPQIAGGTIGGAVGAMIPTVGEEAGLVAGGSKIGQWLAAPAMAGLGGAAGRAYTLNPRDPEYGNKLMFAALEEAGGEYAGRLLAAGAGRLFLRPFRGAVTPGAEAADQALRQSGRQTKTIPGVRPQPRTIIGKGARGVQRKVFKLGQALSDQPGAATRLGKEYGAHLLPGQSTESFMDTLQAVAEGSFFGGGAMRRFQTQTQKAALENLQSGITQTVKRNLISEVGTKKASAILADISNADSKAFSVIEKSLYQAIDDLSEKTIDIKPLQDLAESFSGKGLKPGSREAMLRQVSKKGRQQTFEELKNIRSDAWQYNKKFLKAEEVNNARVAKEIAIKTDELMEQTAIQAGGQLEAAWRTADAFHKGKMRVDWLSKTLAKYGKSEDVATGTGFINYIGKMTKEIDGRPSELARMGFSATEIAGIRRVAAATKLVGEKAVGGGRMLVQLTQAGALMQIAGVPLAALGVAEDNRGVTSAGIAMIIGPTLLAKMMLSPTGSKLLSTGLRAPAGSRSMGTIGARLLREAAYHEAQGLRKGESPQLFMRSISELPRISEQMKSQLKAESKVPERPVSGHHF